MTLKDHASGPGVNPRDNFFFFFEHGVVVVIATAGAEAKLLLGHEDQTSVFAASDNDEDGTDIDTIQMADRTTILLRRGTTRTNTWYTHNSIFSHSWR